MKKNNLEDLATQQNYRANMDNCVIYNLYSRSFPDR